MRYVIAGTTFDFAERTFVMGVLNVTPDSFSDGGKFLSTDAAVDQAFRMIDEGADLIDIGGESTRPRGTVYGTGASQVPAEEELRRILPVIERVHSRSSIPLSVDTWKSSVAGAALDAGASIVNDISGFGFDAAMAQTVHARNATAILMHTPAPPWSMPAHVEYRNVVDDVGAALRNAIDTGERAGVTQLCIDPGLGFGKTLSENFTLIAHLDRLRSLHRPVVVGISRKSFIGAVQKLPVESRLAGSLAAMTVAILHGANIVRVHDVADSRRAAAIADALARSS